MNLKSLLIRYKFKFTIKVLIGLSPINSQKHLIAQVTLLIKPVQSLECCRLLAFRCHATLEMLWLARFNLQFVVRVCTKLEFI